MYSVLIAIVMTIFCAVFIQSEKKDPEKIFGKYSQPGRWYYIKYYSLLCALHFGKCLGVLNEQLKNAFNLSVNKTDVSEKLERIQQLSPSDSAFDGVSFQGVSKNGYYLYGATERLHHGKINGFFYLVVPGFGILHSEHLPGTFLDADPGSLFKNDEYRAKGIRFKPIQPMVKWDISFRGKMGREGHSETELNANFTGEWETCQRYWNCDACLNKKAFARALAKEVWSKSFFKKLLKFPNTFYEQFGVIKGNLLIDNQASTLEMESFRAHHFGSNKEWEQIHRYVSHTMHLDDGTKIRFCVISMPSLISQLEMGYVIRADSKNYSIEETDFALYQHGEKGDPPANMAFSIIAGQTYEVRIMTNSRTKHHVGCEKRINVIECFIDCEVNGVAGKGVIEWYYGNL